MRTDRLAALGALAVILFSAGCGGGSTTTTVTPPAPVPVPAPQLLRFIQGSPDSGTAPNGRVDICVGTQPFGGSTLTAPAVYGTRTQLYLVDGPQTISVYPGIVATPGAECATAPAAFLGVPPIAVTVLPAGTNVRRTIVLGGTVASGTAGLYVYGEPAFVIPPAGFTANTHNAAPAFSAGKPGIGFGMCTATVTPCTVPTNITGAQNLAAPTVSTASAAVLNGDVQSAMNSIPAGFYDGAGVPAGTVVPITSIAAPSPLAFQGYVVMLYAIDAPAGGLNLIGFAEQTTGFGF